MVLLLADNHLISVRSIQTGGILLARLRVSDLTSSGARNNLIPEVPPLEKDYMKT